MIYEVEEIAIPYFFNRYDTIDSIVTALEEDTLCHGVIKRQLLPLLYLVQKRYQAAICYMDEELKNLSTITEEDDRKLAKGYELPGFKRKSPWVNTKYIEYLEYAKRISEYLNSTI